MILCQSQRSVLTTCSSAVLDALHEDACQTDSMVISYYVDSISAGKLSVDDILRAMIKQLVTTRRAIGSTIDTVLENKLRALFTTPTSVPNFTYLLQLVKDLSLQARRIYVLLDGVDAMTENAIIRLIKVIKDLTGSSSTTNIEFRILVFCREVLGCGIRFDDDQRFQVFQITLQNVQKDIHAFVDQQVSIKQDERYLIQNRELLDEIVRVLKVNSAKMYMPYASLS